MYFHDDDHVDNHDLDIDDIGADDIYTNYIDDRVQKKSFIKNSCSSAQARRGLCRCDPVTPPPLTLVAIFIAR